MRPIQLCLRHTRALPSVQALFVHKLCYWLCRPRIRGHQGLPVCLSPGMAASCCHDGHVWHLQLAAHPGCQVSFEGRLCVCVGGGLRKKEEGLPLRQAQVIRLLGQLACRHLYGCSAAMPQSWRLARRGVSMAAYTFAMGGITAFISTASVLPAS